ncbi:MAG: cupin domain-containing protein [bacterium]
MKIRDYHKIEQRAAYPREGARGVGLRVAIAKEDGARDLAMRVYELDPGGFTPLHSHPWEHAVFIVRGSGKIFDGKKECRLEQNDCLYIAPDEKHQITNTGDQTMLVISVVPIKEDEA